MNIKSVTILLFLLRFSTCFSLEEFLWSSLDSASVPTSPINITRDATEVEDTTTTASEDGEVQGIFNVTTGLKSEAEDGRFWTPPYCRCIRPHFCSPENRIRQERAINRPNCAGRDVMCCESPRITCGSVEKLGSFRPFRGYGEASYGAYPWTALVIDGRKDVIYGTGILISPNKVLTTARNIEKFRSRPFRVRLGEWDLASSVEPFQPVELRVREVITHQAYNPKTFQNDIAVLRLNQSIDLEGIPSIRPICLPQQGQDLKYINSVCWTAGWGTKSDQRAKGRNLLREVDMKVLGSGVCERAIRRAIGNRDYIWDDLSFVCGGGEEGKGLCRGDEGTALVCADDSLNPRWTLVGMSSWGTTCGQGGFPPVFTNIPTYVNWIKSIQ